ncbi:MAG: hypothetical protein WBB28_02700 [Crinalium sp.]
MILVAKSENLIFEGALRGRQYTLVLNVTKKLPFIVMKRDRIHPIATHHCLKY